MVNCFLTKAETFVAKSPGLEIKDALSARKVYPALKGSRSGMEKDQGSVPEGFQP